ncbi:MAG TPA: Mpo1-like protein [Acidimicrobiia bacterium]|nr:Mpo1-like protein [Acidimicrobiia bacterium]
MNTTRLVPAPSGPRLLRGWLERHQHPFSFYLHLIGIPMTLLALPLLVRHQWRRALGLFGGGYTLQFLGHMVEGNPPGEVLALQRRLSKKRESLTV